MSVARQSALILGLGWVLMPLQVLTSAVVARVVGPEGKGIIFLLAGVTAVVSSLTGLGIGHAAAAFYNQKRYSAGQILASTLLLTASSFVLVGLAYLLLSDLFVGLFLGDLQTLQVRRLWIALALVSVLPNQLLGVGDVLLIADNAMKVYALRNTGTAVVGLLLTWLLTFGAGLGVTGVLLSQPLASLFGLGVIAWWYRRRHSVRELRHSMATSRDLLRVGLQQSAVHLVALVAKRLDGFIIARLLTVADAGYYSVANNVQSLFVNVPRATMWPLVTALSGDDPNRHQALVRVTRILTFLLVLGTLLFLPLAPWLVVLVFGDSFAPAVSPLRWALLGVFATPITIGINALFTAQRRPARTIVASIPSTVVQVILNFALVPHLGASGSAIALSANYLLTTVIMLVQVRMDGEVSVRAMLLPTREDFVLVGGWLAGRARGFLRRRDRG